MAAQLGLIVHAAEAHALELTAQRPGDRLAERRLADARRADEAQDRRLRLRVHLQDAEVFEDPLLDFLQTEVVLVQNLARVGDLEVVFGELVPRQFEHQLEIGADYVVFGRRSRQLLQPAKFAVQFLANVFRKVGLLELLAQDIDFGLLRALSRPVPAGWPASAAEADTRAAPWTSHFAHCSRSCDFSSST